MSESITQHESLNNLASLLRLVAGTLRLFSDTETHGGNYISELTDLSLRVDENAAVLSDFVTRKMRRGNS